jgi:hypothetical protein
MWRDAPKTIDRFIINQESLRATLNNHMTKAYLRLWNLNQPCADWMRVI